MWRDKPFVGGFLLTNESIESVVHFDRRALPGGWSFWSDEAVSTSYQEADGDFVLLRGHWADLSDDAHQHEEVAAALLRSRLRGLSEFHEHLARIAGRYVVVVGNRSAVNVYHDATGLRSVYYSTQSDTACSHLHLLNRYERSPSNGMDDKTAITAMDLTPYVWLRQLLPNFHLDILARRAERYFPTQPNRYVGLTTDALLDRIEELWDRELQRYAQTHPKTAISVTGGLDSRLMIAMSRRHWESYSSYTYGLRRSGGSFWADNMKQGRDIVQQLLPHLSMREHTFIDLEDREPVSAELNQLLDQNTWLAHARYLIPTYRQIFPGDGWLHMRGTGVEIIRRYWRRRPVLDALLDKFARPGAPDLRPRARDLGYGSSMHGYHLIDIGYWEIRMGRWHAELLNEQDAAYDTFLPISTREIYEILLAFPEKEREDAFAVRELINRRAPLLNFFGANDRRNLYEQDRDRRRQDTREPLENMCAHNATTNTSHHLPDARQLELPVEHFTVGSSISARVMKAPRAGSARFTLRQPYASDRALNHFEWQILVNGAVNLRCDGAATSAPTHVTVAGLSSGDVISVRIVASRNLQKSSWSRATRTSIHELTFTSRANHPTLVVVSDCEFATPGTTQHPLKDGSV